jgi:hypothetical protein
VTGGQIRPGVVVVDARTGVRFRIDAIERVTATTFTVTAGGRTLTYPAVDHGLRVIA